MAVVFLLVAGKVNDKLILRHINNTSECNSGNDAVGICEAGGYIATGLIMYGCLTGNGTNVEDSIISTAVFFVIGQVVLLLMTYVYEYITPYALIRDIENGNKCAAVTLAAKMVAIGIILQNAIAGDFTTWNEGLSGFAYTGLVGIGTLIAVEKIISLILLKGSMSKYVDKQLNMSAVLVTQLPVLGLALLITKLF